MKKIAGVKSVRLAARSPNLNAFAERIVRTIKKECLSRMVQIAEGSLQAVIGQFFEHSHGEKPPRIGERDYQSGVHYAN